VSRGEQELRDLLDQTYEMPYGAAQMALLEQIIAGADALQLTELSFEARMQATTCYVQGGEPARAVVTFTWCLSEYDRDPRTYGGYQHLMLWHFKYMVAALTRFPEVALDRTYAVLDDMQRRWTETGHSLHAVYAYRHFIARHVGDLDLAEDYYRRWCAAPRDQLSDCIGCDPTSKVWWLSFRGRHEEAVALAQPVLAGTLTCVEQPQGILTNLLEPYLLTGRRDDARDAHRRAYRLHRPNRADLADIGEHVRFCARTVNAARGVEILERHLGWLDRPPSPWTAMMFAAAGALTLRHAGPGLTIHRPSHQDRPASDVDGEILGAELTAFCLDVAGRFDARNQSDQVSSTVREMLEAEPVGDYLPLSPTAHRSSTVVAPPPPPPPPVEAAAFVMPDLLPDELLDLVEELDRTDRYADAEQAGAEFVRRYPVEGLTVPQRARSARWRAGALADDFAGAEAVLAQAVADYAELGDPVNVQVSRARLGVLRARTGSGDEGLAEALAATEELLADPSAQVRCDAVLRVLPALLSQGRLAEALSLVDRVQDALSEVSAQDRARVMFTRLIGLAEFGRLDQVLAVGPATIEAMTAAGLDAGLARAHHALSSAMQRTGDLVGAIEQIGAAIRYEDDPEMNRRLRGHLAFLLTGTDRAADAIEPLADAVAEYTAVGDAAGAADSRHWLAVAYLRVGRTLDAAEVAEEELAYWSGQDEADTAYPRQRCRRLLADVYRRLDQPQEAIAQLEQVVQLAESDPSTVADALEQLGDILDFQDRDREAAEHFARAADAYLQAADSVGELRCRRRHAVSLSWADEPERAAAAIQAADALAEASPDSPAVRWERAVLDFDAARLLHKAGPDEAAARAGRAAEAFGELDQRTEAAQSHRLRAWILLEADRPAEAEAAARRGLASGAPESMRDNLIDLLRRAIRAQGRHDEARDA
jgi:tetratricopeptide (TPR) repeat protein